MGSPRARLGRNFIHDRAAEKTYSLYGTASHNYAAGTTAWTLDENEQEATLLLPTNAGGGVTITLPAAKPGKWWIIYNNSGQTVTFQVTSGPTIATGKYGIYACNATEIVEIYEQP